MTKKLAVAATVALALGLGRTAVADEAATCHLLEIRASSDGAEIDGALKPLARKLKKPPFSAWSRFALLKQHDRSAARMKSVDVDLVTGGKLSLLFRDKGDKGRLRLTFTLDDKGGKRLFNGTVNLEGGDYTLIGGESLDGGATYILGVTCRG
jgi:hypothetical protein